MLLWLMVVGSEMSTRVQSKISPFGFVFGVKQKN